MANGKGSVISEFEGTPKSRLDKTIITFNDFMAKVDLELSLKDEKIKELEERIKILEG